MNHLYYITNLFDNPYLRMYIISDIYEPKHF